MKLHSFATSAGWTLIAAGLVACSGGDGTPPSGTVRVSLEPAPQPAR